MDQPVESKAESRHSPNQRHRPLSTVMGGYFENIANGRFDRSTQQPIRLGQIEHKAVNAGAASAAVKMIIFA